MITVLCTEGLSWVNIYYYYYLLLLAIFNVVDLSATAFKIKITRKEVFELNIIQENHKVNAVLSEDSKLRRKKKP